MTAGSRFAAIDQRQLDVFQRSGTRQQVETLKHEAEVIAPQQRALVARQLFDADTLEFVAAAAGRVEAAEDVHRCRLARTAGTHDGDEVTGIDGEIDALQSLEGGLPAAIGLGDAGQPDEGLIAH